MTIMKEHNPNGSNYHSNTCLLTQHPEKYIKNKIKK